MTLREKQTLLVLNGWTIKYSYYPPEGVAMYPAGANDIDFALRVISTDKETYDKKGLMYS